MASIKELVIPIDEFEHPRILESGLMGIPKGYQVMKTKDDELIFVKWGSKNTVLQEALFSDWLNVSFGKTPVFVPNLLDFRSEGEMGIAGFGYIDPKHKYRNPNQYTESLMDILTALRDTSPELLDSIHLPVRDKTYYWNRLTNLTSGLKDGGVIADPIAIEIERVVENKLSGVNWQDISFVHSDLAPHNLTIHNHQQYVYDFEFSALGQHGEDLGRLTLFYRIFSPKVYKMLMSQASDEATVEGFQTIQALFLANHYTRKALNNPGDKQAQMLSSWWNMISVRMGLDEKPFTEGERVSFINQDETLVTGRAALERLNYMPQHIGLEES